MSRVHSNLMLFHFTAVFQAECGRKTSCNIQDLLLFTFISARASHENHANVSMGESLDGVVEENVLYNGKNKEYFLNISIFLLRPWCVV